MQCKHVTSFSTISHCRISEIVLKLQKNKTSSPMIKMSMLECRALKIYFSLSFVRQQNTNKGLSFYRVVRTEALRAWLLDWMVVTFVIKRQSHWFYSLKYWRNWWNTFNILESLTFCAFLRDACYHLGSNLVTASDAEVECGLLGGRLASFVLVSEVTSLKTVIPANDLWIGKH